jgi:hypothetical protein
MKRELLSVCSFAALTMAATLPYAGKWKVNLAKSDFGQTTVTIESLPGGQWQSTAFGITYKFKMDGNDYPDNMGGTAAWKAVDRNTWELVAKANGKVTETDTFKLSADGKTLTDAVRQMKADGGSIDSTTVYQRVSGGPSLTGKWRTQKVSGASGVIELTPSGTDGLTGPMLAPGFTVAMTNKARSLNLTVKKDGKPFFTATYTVTADGKSMTEAGTLASGEKIKVLYDRM